MEPLWNMKEGPRSGWIVRNGSSEETWRQSTQLSIPCSFSYKVSLRVCCLRCQEARGASLLTSDPRSSEVRDGDHERARQHFLHEEEKGWVLVVRTEQIRSPDISLPPQTTKQVSAEPEEAGTSPSQHSGHWTFCQTMATQGRRGPS